MITIDSYKKHVIEGDLIHFFFMDNGQEVSFPVRFKGDPTLMDVKKSVERLVDVVNGPSRAPYRNEHDGYAGGPAGRSKIDL